ncbi:hypothetical protein OFM04_36825, partial [Escherichia coli]|nr:hypothetical protein [Escherichia coli]
RHTLSWIGCGLSYKLLMLLAEKDALDEITICEDDVLFLPGWEKRLNAALSTLKESGVQWDILSGLIADLHPDASINRV